ncbi:hypothetical protein TNCT_714211 [Trichonephila clavata]|uniref:Uncharacterized protein n=1 Tax=Trichonephila clavata TaxID=2740835 RepID=A0A8X6GU34_TRICU|nr:hypothetical protein TNCT_714211 [Trichonephila clavata]
MKIFHLLSYNSASSRNISPADKITPTEEGCTESMGLRRQSRRGSSHRWWEWLRALFLKSLNRTNVRRMLKILTIYRFSQMQLKRLSKTARKSYAFA